MSKVNFAKTLSQYLARFQKHTSKVKYCGQCGRRLKEGDYYVVRHYYIKRFYNATFCSLRCVKEYYKDEMCDEVS